MNFDEQLFPSWKRQFAADGFLKIGGLLSPDELQSIERELETYVREVTPDLSPTDVVWESQPAPDGSRRFRNLWRMERHSQYFADLPHTPELLQLAGALVNGTPVLMAVEMFAKPARVGSAVPYHQDNAYFNLVPPDAFTCWIALDESTEQNGCVYYCRGSHLSPPLAHKGSGVPGNSLMAELAPDDVDEVAGVLRPGDAMMHHCQTLHRSDPNRSERSRRGLLIVYRGAHCQTDPAGARAYAAALTALQKSMA